MVLLLAAVPAHAILLPIAVPAPCLTEDGLPAPPACGAWRRLADLPQAVEGHAMAWSAADRVLVIQGGRDGAGQVTGATWALDPYRDIMRPLAPGPARAHAAYAWDEASRSLYLLGGEDQDGTPRAGLWRYHLPSDTWTRLVAPDEPVRGTGPAAVWDPVREVLWTYGGWDGRNQSGALHRYDPVANAWWLGPNAPVGRWAHSLVWDADRGVVLLHGGQQDPGPELPEVWQYDPDVDLWSVSTPGLIHRARHAAVWDTQAGAMLAFGGTTNVGQRVADVAAFGPLDAIESVEPVFLYRAGVWVLQAPLPAPIADLAAAWDAQAGLAYVSGGSTGAGPSAEVWAFAPGLLTDAVG